MPDLLPLCCRISAHLHSRFFPRLCPGFWVHFTPVNLGKIKNTLFQKPTSLSTTYTFPFRIFFCTFCKSTQFRCFARKSAVFTRKTTKNLTSKMFTMWKTYIKPVLNKTQTKLIRSVIKCKQTQNKHTARIKAHAVCLFYR